MGTPDPLDLQPISIIVITHNEAQNIRGCLDSLLLQDYPPEKYEIIVVDSSSDETPQIVQQYKRVRLIKSEKGYSQQRNKGWQAAKYELVAFTDADCLIPPEWLKKINHAFKNEKIAGIGGNAFPPHGTAGFGLWTACVGHPAGGAVGFDANIKMTKNGVYFVAGCNSAFRKRALSEVGGFDPRFYDGGEDVDLSRRLRAKGFFLAYIPDFTVYHKPRNTLKSYCRWNINVGITKYNLWQPSWPKIILQPSFPVWSALIFLSWIFLFAAKPLQALLVAAGLWLSLLTLLFFGAQPFPLLIKRRKQIGVNLLTILTVVPFLIWLRQVCISLGQFKKWWTLKIKKEFYLVFSLLFFCLLGLHLFLYLA